MQTAPDTTQNKLLISICGERTVLFLTIQSLFASEIITGLVLVVRPEDFEAASQVLEAVEATTKTAFETKIVEGGASRQESVYAGLLAVPAESEFVMIHDGARPHCPPNLIRAVADEAARTGAAILGVPVRSTLKRTSSTQTVVKTVSRDNLWAAQTPQVFSLKLLLSAHEKAKADGFTATDDSELVERLGREVTIVEGSQYNIKVTTPEDVVLLRAVLQNTTNTCN